MTTPTFVVVESPSDAAGAAREFPQHRKLLSWLYMVELGMPTVCGIIVTSWDDDAMAAATAFAATRGAGALLLRSDRAPEKPEYPRGGFIVNLEDLDAEVPPFLHDDRLVFLLEPKSPFEDVYSMSIGLKDLSAHVEVVGPGFDASDLKRGDDSPHETLNLTRAGARWVIAKRSAVSDEAYRASYERRLAKVGRILARAADPLTDCQALATAHRELTRCGQPLLLHHATQYDPIPTALVERAVELAAGAYASLTAKTGSSDQIFSASYVGTTDDLVFWDVVWPSRKYGRVQVRDTRDAAAPVAVETALQGLPASAGTYTGIAYVASSPQEFDGVNAGNVLVTPTTTPEIVVVLEKIGGIVTDYGGRLSHAAVVAREARIPAVVGTERASRVIRSGDTVFVDGDRGIVSVVSR